MERSLSPGIGRCRQKRRPGLWPRQTFSRQNSWPRTETGSSLHPRIKGVSGLAGRWWPSYQPHQDYSWHAGPCQHRRKPLGALGLIIESYVGPFPVDSLRTTDPAHRYDRLHAAPNLAQGKASRAVGDAWSFDRPPRLAIPCRPMHGRWLGGQDANAWAYKAIGANGSGHASRIMPSADPMERSDCRSDVSPFILRSGNAVHVRMAMTPCADLAQVAPQLRRTVMKKLLAIAALGAVLTAPAYAQAPNTRDESARADWPSRVHVYAPETYARSRGNANTNPDFQLGGDR